MKTLILVALLVAQFPSTPPVSPYARTGQPPNPFHFDGCSAPTPLLRQVYDLPAFQSACYAHDWAYWWGGTEIDRAKADGRFYLALLDAGATPEMAYQMFNAVHLFGATPLAGSCPWGCGWKK